MRIGDGVERTKQEDMVMMPRQIAISSEGECSIHIQQIFPQLESHGWDESYMVERTILASKNEDV
ncbi:hypothetical protein SESBI_31441 [Sesbania bispinosa]|nr:hypothetical protein SESBI_31441 [Sesbania bispinosa]